jgi:DinB superfamily
MNISTQQPTSALFIKMAIDAWNTQVKQMNKLLDTFSDEQWLAQIAPNKNRGIYILGHLAAVNDYMLPILGLSERLHAEWEPLFIHTPDNPATEYPSLQVLKDYWKQVNETLATHFASMETETWFQKHTSVTEEVFAREPHRNKLNVLINRTNHQSYHIGQLVLLKSS